MIKRRVVAMVVIGCLGGAVGGTPHVSAAETECTGTAEMAVSPGMSREPTSGIIRARNGTEHCTGAVNGADPTGDPAVEWDGRYGTRDGSTCASGGEGWGVAYHTVKTKDGPKVFRNVFTITYGGLQNGLISGTFRGDYFSGTFTFRPLDGDCVTAPMTKVEARFRGTWHDYEAD